MGKRHGRAPSKDHAQWDQGQCIFTQGGFCKISWQWASASIGYSLYPLQTSNIDLAIQFADIALYEAKQMGKARYTKYSINTLPTEA